MYYEVYQEVLKAVQPSAKKFCAAALLKLVDKLGNGGNDDDVVSAAADNNVDDDDVDYDEDDNDDDETIIRVSSQLMNGLVPQCWFRTRWSLYGGSVYAPVSDVLRWLLKWEKDALLHHRGKLSATQSLMAEVRAAT